MEIIEFLLEQYPEGIKTGDNNRLLPLHIATKGGKANLKLVKLLVDKYPKAVNKMDKMGCTPVHYACEKNSSILIARMMIEKYSQIRMIADNKNVTPLHHACSKQASVDIIRLLLSNYPQAMKHPTKEGRNPLHIAVVNRLSMEGIQAIIDAHPYAVLEPDRKGLTPLHVACEGKPFRPPIEVIDLLLKTYPEGLLATTENGSIPLHMASRGKYAKMDVVEKLIHEYPEGIEMLNSRDATPAQCSRAKEVREYYQNYQLNVMKNQVCPCIFKHPLETIAGENAAKEAEESLLEKDGLMHEKEDGGYVESQNAAIRKKGGRTNRRLLNIPADLGESENWEVNGGVAMTPAGRTSGMPVPPPPPPPMEEPPAHVMVGEQENFPDDLTQDTTLFSEAPSKISAKAPEREAMLV